MGKVRMRKDLEHLTVKERDTVVRAFDYLQKLPPDHLNSFFTIAGYYGLPQPQYCNHGNILFPTWHRAYMLRLENALRSAPGCGDFSMPYWNETENSVEGLYFKPEGYETVRYPYSGLVGPEFKDKTIAHNNDVNENTPEQVTQILNENIRTWLTAETFKNHEGKDALAGEADKFRDCLKADNYMVFSNTTSAKASNDKNKGDPAIPSVIAIESPHNAMHLAIGGFDIPKQGDYDKYALR
ncbi:tyrosinase [Diplogelasinospora grovesii]|uniref:tyrosinase n=1 Tax=Diplogelasinospora grovesii TaxID=303347 RepID=A0AAN6S0I6_9PEZI|nr:tyrosinase [Diplogelasinospora grovesii]